MTEAQLAEILINGHAVREHVQGNALTGLKSGTGTLNKKVSVYHNRLLLRIFSVPSLMNFLVDTRAFEDPEKGEGAAKIQLDFLRLPDEIRPELERLLAAPTPPKFYRYVKNGSARTGVEIEVDPSELEGDKFDYAF